MKSLLGRAAALSALGAGLALAGAGTAAAATSASQDDSGSASPLEAVGTSGNLAQTPLYPLAGTPVDPLSNNVSTNVGGIPVDTHPVTGMFRDGLPVSNLPLVGGLLP